MPQFDSAFFVSQIFWLSCSFALLYLMISKYIAPNIDYIINKRTGTIEGHISEAQELNDKIKAIELHKASIRDEINTQIADMENLANKMFDEQYSQKQQKLFENIKRMQQNNSHKIDKHIAVFKAEQSKYGLKLAKHIIKKITQKEADAKKLAAIQEQ